MRYFGREERAARYDACRPQVHERVLQHLLAEHPLSGPARALDVGCGTGHSTAALAAQGLSAAGLDIEAAMLHRARSSGTACLFVLGDARSLPFRDSTFSLVTASMAFHWLEADRFLAETARVLRSNGYLYVYNLWFPGQMRSDPEFSTWHSERYLARYPSPSRHSITLKKALTDSTELRFVESHQFDFDVPFTARSLRDYLTTQSNVEAALQTGADLAAVDAWLDSELAAFFAKDVSRQFAYNGSAALAVAS